METGNQVLAVTQSGYNLVDIANLAIALGIIIAGSLSIIYIFMGGISFILSGGDEEKIKKAIHTIRYAVIGLIVTIFSVTIIAIVGNIFNFDLTEYIRWDRMTDMIRTIVGNISNDGGINTDTIPVNPAPNPNPVITPAPTPTPAPLNPNIPEVIQPGNTPS